MADSVQEHIMSKVLLFSDLHVHCHKRRVERLEDCLKALEWVFDVADENNITNILFGGDLFHDRQKIEVYTYQRTFDVLYERLQRRPVNLHLLLGNHDIWFNELTSISSVFPLKTLPGVRIISRPERIKIENSTWDFIPFTHNPLDTLEELRNLPGTPQYGLGHIAVDGAVLHGSTYSDVAVEHDGDMVKVSAGIFKDYKRVFLGHYHGAQNINSTVEYIGSPLQLSFGEAFERKHLILFDTQKDSRDYIENTFSPKHLIIKAEDREKHDLKNNFVKLIVDNIGTTDLISMRKDLLKDNTIGSLEIKQNKKQIDEHVVQDAKSILFKGNEMLAQYIKEVGPKGLDEELLLQIGNEICQVESSK